MPVLNAVPTLAERLTASVVLVRLPAWPRPRVTENAAAFRSVDTVHPHEACNFGFVTGAMVASLKPRR